MQLGQFNITVRKIVNGYIVTFPLPKKKVKGKEFEEQEERSSGLSMVDLWMGRSTKGEDDTAEWYCPTKKALEEILPKLVMESYHGQVTLKDEV